MTRPVDRLSCAFCHDSFQPTKLDQLRYRRLHESARLHERLAPLNLWGSIGVAAITMLLLIGMIHHGAPGDLFTTVEAWLFPVWITVLTLGIWMISRLHRAD